MEIKRDKYLNLLISRQGNGLIKVITGIRRCGKSYLLFKLFYNHLLKQGVAEENIICIPLDDVDFEEYCNPLKLNEYIKSKLIDKKKQYYIFIDEAQYAITKEERNNLDAPIRVYGVLNSLLRKSNVDVYITGSNSKFLSTDIMTEFRGRGDEIHISPLSFSEYFPASSYENEEKAWLQYLTYGGLPHILSESDNESKARYLHRLNSEIYLKDICERYAVKNDSNLISVMRVVASGIGALTNAQKISNTFISSGIKAVTMPTISNYLKYLQESFMVQKAEKYDIKGRKYISTPSKYYYTDLGLRNELLNFRQIEWTHLMENAIYNELIYRGYNVDVGIVETRAAQAGRTVRKQLEVDFVVNQGSKRYYIQSAYTLSDKEKMDQEQASLTKIPDSFKKIIVVGDYSPIWRNDAGITIINIYDFLLNENSLDI